MNNDLLEGIDKMLLADKKANEALVAGARKILNAMQAKRDAHKMKKQAMEEDIERGARLTKHRISL